MRRWSFVVTAVFLAAGSARGEVTLPAFFSDGMVLQRDCDVPVWGKAAPGAQITVTLGDEQAATRVGDDGHWQVRLAPHSAGGPHRLLIQESQRPSREIVDVYFGEVWLASGQSNMQWTFSHDIQDKEQVLDAANDPLLRQFTIKKFPHYVRKTEVNVPQWDAPGRWRRANRADLLADGEDGDSALAYFFGCALRRELNVPVGIVNASIGGSPIASWLPPEGGLYNKMIHPLAPYALRGLVWYQGEANIVAAGVGYVDSMQQLLQVWRGLWKQEFPCYYVQLAPFIHSTRPNSKAPSHALPGLWEAQTRVMSVVPRTGMVVTTDLADEPTNIHPRNKRDVGERLARWALAKDYGRTDVVFSGPQFRSEKVDGNGLRIEFDFTDGGLASRDGRPLTHFTIAGADRKFVPAEATIDGKTVVVRSKQVPRPVAVRFAWDELARPNLVNGAGLPAGGFRTDDWPLGE
jgi:sialate O-acetylesterase